MTKLILPGHFDVWLDPPGDDDGAALHVASASRRIKIVGKGLRWVFDEVLPLLDGQHMTEDVIRRLAGAIAPDELTRCLQFLVDHHLVRDVDGSDPADELSARLAPQLGFFHELYANPSVIQRRLSDATVTIFGLGGAGAAVALSLAAAGVGALRCVDTLPVSPADPFLSPAYPLDTVGLRRIDVIAQEIAKRSPQVTVVAYPENIVGDEDARRALDGADFAVCCADPGLAELFYRVNRAALRARVPWTSCSVSASEGVIGPTIRPYQTACYLCYRMREAAAARRPEDAVSYQAHLAGQKRDRNAVRENLTFAIGIVGNLAGLEVFKALTGVLEPSAVGHIVVVDLMSLQSRRHSVLRRPRCPACSKHGPESTDVGGLAIESERRVTCPVP